MAFTAAPPVEIKQSQRTISSVGRGEGTSLVARVRALAGKLEKASSYVVQNYQGLAIKHFSFLKLPRLSRCCKWNLSQSEVFIKISGTHHRLHVTCKNAIDFFTNIGRRRARSFRIYTLKRRPYSCTYPTDLNAFVHATTSEKPRHTKETPIPCPTTITR